MKYVFIKCVLFSVAGGLPYSESLNTIRSLSSQSSGMWSHFSHHMCSNNEDSHLFVVYISLKVN